LKFIDGRLDSMLRVPEMWGADESVELQILQLLQLRWLTLSPESEQKLGRIKQDYIQYVRSKFPQEPPETLAAILARHGRRAELSALLEEFVEQERRKADQALMYFPTGKRMLDDEPSSFRPPRHSVS
jgi:hypothetical protein